MVTNFSAVGDRAIINAGSSELGVAGDYSLGSDCPSWWSSVVPCSKSAFTFAPFAIRFVFVGTINRHGWVWYDSHWAADDILKISEVIFEVLIVFGVT